MFLGSCSHLNFNHKPWPARFAHFGGVSGTNRWYLVATNRQHLDDFCITVFYLHLLCIKNELALL